MSRRDILGTTFATPDPYLAATAAGERTKGLAHVRRINNEWRREVGMPSRSVESVREANARIVASVGRYQEALDKCLVNIRAAEHYVVPHRFMAGVPIHNPGAPDGRNSWEDAPRPERFTASMVERLGGAMWLDEPTPIYDQLQRERGAA